jgi:hypothetical protein
VCAASTLYDPNPQIINGQPGECLGNPITVAGGNIIAAAQQSPPWSATGPGKAYVVDKATLSPWMTLTGSATGDCFAGAITSYGTGALAGAPFESTWGAAYWINGTQRLKIPNPNPNPNAGARFGFAVAPLGSDFLISACRDDPGNAPECGAVYLYNQAGTLLHTFRPPTIAPELDYGYSVTPVGNNMVLIGAQRAGPGTAYLYERKGTDWVLDSAISPGDVYFGRCAAAIGNEVMIAGWDNTYVYDVSQPTNPVLRALLPGGKVTAVGNDILTAYDGGSEVDLYDGATFSLLQSFHIPAGGIGAIAGDRDGIYIGDQGANNYAGAVYVFRAAPEPSTFVLLGVGMMGLLAYAWRKRRVP